MVNGFRKVLNDWKQSRHPKLNDRLYFIQLNSFIQIFLSG